MVQGGAAIINEGKREKKRNLTDSLQSVCEAYELEPAIALDDRPEQLSGNAGSVGTRRTLMYDDSILTFGRLTFQPANTKACAPKLRDEAMQPPVPLRSYLHPH